MTVLRSQGTYDRFAAAVDLPLTVLAIAWLPVLVVPLVVHLSGGTSQSFEVTDYVIWALFAVEYLAKLYLAPERGRFVRQHLFDLVVVAVPVLRPLRGLRLLRLFDLSRATTLVVNALRRLRAILTHRGLHFVLLSVVILIFALAALVLNFEAHAHGSNIHNCGQALWWAIVTVTTVGYGDTYPVTAAGRGVAVVLMLVGIGLIGVLTATVASYFVEEKSDRDKEELNARLERIEAMLTNVLARSQEQAPSSNGSSVRPVPSELPKPSG